jgi:D-alanyl-D-alanine carboxypeptidase/D-alanyl-D-alanine-endopeptidase (penicillin-binding protein 4)
LTTATFSTDLLGVGWEWDDAQFYYGAEVSALTVNVNVVTFTVTATKTGSAPLISVQPRTAYVKVINHATTSGQGAKRIGVHRPLDSNTVEFFGTIPKGEKVEIQIAVHDPALFAATLLKKPWRVAE